MTRRGFTLVELLAALVMLGLVAGAAGVSLASLRAPPTSDIVRTLRAARAEAIRAGEATAWSHGPTVVRFYADGSSSGGRVTVEGRTVAIDPLTGAVRAID